MKFIVAPIHGKWRWRLVETGTGEIILDGTDMCDTPREARAAAKAWRSRVYMTPVEMGT